MTHEIVKLGEKGQMTLPYKMRQREHLSKGDLLEVQDLGHGSFLVSKHSHQEELRAMLRTLGRRLDEQGYTSKKKITELCNEVRSEVQAEWRKKYGLS